MVTHNLVSNSSAVITCGTLSQFPLYPISLGEMEISLILTIAGSTKLRQIKEMNTQ